MASASVHPYPPPALENSGNTTLTAFLDDFPDALLLLDQDSTIAFANPRAAHLFGLAKIDLQGRPVADFVPSADRAQWAVNLADLARPGQRPSAGPRRRLRIVHSGGAVVPLSVGMSITDFHGRPAALCSLVRAEWVAPQRADEVRVDARFREAQRIGKIGSWEWDLVNDRHWWSDELYRILDIDPATTPQPFEAFLARMHPEDRDLIANNAVRNVAAGVVEPLDARIVLPDGTNKVFRAYGTTEADEHGKPLRAYGTFQDITEQKAAEAALHRSDLRYREAQRLARIGNWEWDLATNTSWWSEELYRILEEDPATYEPSFDNFLNKVHPDDRHVIVEGRGNVTMTPDSYKPVELRIPFADGREKVVEQLVTVRVGSKGQPEAVIGTIHDVTERRALERQLRESESMYSGTVELAAVGIAHVDAAGQFIWANRRLCDMLGYSIGELVGLTIPQVSHAEDIHVSDGLRERQHAGEIDSSTLEKRYLHKNGTVVWVRITGATRRDEHGQTLYDICVIEDVTARKAAEERVKYLATHDELTGLPNRTLFAELLDHALESSRRSRRQCAVLFIDLDRFKIVNDSLGHQAGDTLLKEMSARFKRSVRKSDVVARLGGDEFVILLEGADDAAVGRLAAKLLAVAMTPVDVMGHECRVTASIGIATCPKHAGDAETLMKYADAAMYVAKNQGKNNYQFYSLDESPFSVQRLVLEAQLNRALAQQEFVLYYQPKVDLATGTIKGTEALLRWRNAELGLVPPAQFIPIAEDTGLIVPIGRWVLRTACAQNAAWQRQGLPPVAVCVNLSPRQFNEPALLSDIESVLQETGMPPHLLELEITEGMIMHDVDRAVAQATAIKKLGVRLAIDDFGTGYSSLSQLKRFPIDTLKIDRSFIRDVARNAEDVAITEAIIALGKALDVTVIAEGVENSEQCRFLRRKGCDEVQGFYFGMPGPPEEFADLLLHGASETPACSAAEASSDPAVELPILSAAYALGS